MPILNDSLYKVLTDSITTLNNQPKTFWDYISKSDVNLIIIIVSLVTILLSTYLNYLFNIRSKNKEFRSEFYKKLIDKKLKAYENIETFLYKLRVSSTTEDKPYHIDIFRNRQAYETFMEEFYNGGKTAIWLSDDLANSLGTFNNYLYNKFGTKPTLNDEELKYLAKEEFGIINGFYNKIEVIIINDFYNLDKFKKVKIKKKGNKNNATKK